MSSALKPASDRYKNEKNINSEKMRSFKKDAVLFIKNYTFLSQIINFEDENLEKLSLFLKALLSHLIEESEDSDFDILDIELIEQETKKQETTNIILENNENLKNSNETATKKDPQKKLLSELIKELNSLFQGNFSEEELINFNETIKNKITLNTDTMQILKNNSKEQAIIGGFEIAITDTIIDNFEDYSEISTELLSNEEIKDSFTNIIYTLTKKDI